jgi:hypothetical protein
MTAVDFFTASEGCNPAARGPKVRALECGIRQPTDSYRLSSATVCPSKGGSSAAALQGGLRPLRCAMQPAGLHPPQGRE